MDVFLNQLILRKIFNPGAESSSNQLDVIAPDVFYGLDFKPEDTNNLLEKIIAGIDQVSLCFFEANLGSPGNVNANTEALDLLANKYPQTMFVLKSNTPQSIDEAKKHLLSHHHFLEYNIISQPGKDILTEGMIAAIKGLLAGQSDENTPSL